VIPDRQALWLLLTSVTGTKELALCLKEICVSLQTKLCGLKYLNIYKINNNNNNYNFVITARMGASRREYDSIA
jgi:hypothetical protein